MKRGFSLVELSIVLVILGLLTGGILAGQSLIRSAELRSGLNQMQSYVTAHYAFRDKYFQIAGDLDNASSFWPGVPNGNGNRIVSHGEGLYSWLHLASAGLIEGSYTGVLPAAGGGLITNPGENVPVGKVSGTSFHFEEFNTIDASDPSYFAGVYGNAFSYGTSPYTYWNMGATAFTPEETWNMDTKIDDGKPGTGKIVPNLHGLDCADSGDEANAQYKLSSKTKGCALYYRNVI